MDAKEEKMDAKTLKKLAKQKAREEMLMRIRKETLERELAMDEASLHKMKDKWFDAIVDTKVPQMQDNLKHILHYMEKLIEAENFRKLLFESERQDLEEASTLLAQSHGSALETLFDIYQKRVQDMHAAYNQMVTAKKEEAEAEFKGIEEREKETQENMHTMLYQMKQNRDKDEDTMNCAMFLKLDDERSKNTEIKENLRSKLEKKMETRWGEISATLSKYEEVTKDRRKEYMMLKAKDDADSKIIYQQMKKTQKLFEQLDELKNCMDNCYAPKETLSLIEDTREERTKFFSTFKQLKRILADELKEDEINMKTLSVVTNSTTTYLKEICTKGEQILTLFRICQRLETEDEKVLPVGMTYLPKTVPMPDARKRTKAKALEKESVSAQKASDNWTVDIEGLEKFWRKLGKAKLSKLAIEKCIQNLRKENAILKKILTTYLNEVSEKM